jgi:hypothetical protein
MKTVLQIVLTIAIIVLGYLCVESIQKPVRFQKNYEKRKDKVIERLENIRSAQNAYKSVHKKFTGSFDTLLQFVKNDSLPMVRMEGRLSDSMLEAGITELKALKLGIIKRDTIRVSVKDSLFVKGFNIDSLRFVPYTKGEKFVLGTGIIKTASGVDVPVFEAKVLNDIYLKGLENQEIINLNDKTLKLEKFPGLKVGSLEEANNSAGNWE